MNSKKIKISHVYAPISIGELIDKITILEIKKEHITGEKLKNIAKELQLLKDIIQDRNLKINVKLINNLQEINKKLWQIEDQIRTKEKKQLFDEEFIELARSVYLENDRRSYIKKEINLKYNSEIIEEKSYQ